MVDKALMQALFTLVAEKDKPLTKISAGLFPNATVKKFMAACKKTGKKAMIDCARTLCTGKANHKRVNWTAEFQELAMEHFEFQDFWSIFTTEGHRTQLIAKELHRQTAKRTNLSRKAGPVAQELASALYHVCKRAALYGAKIEAIDSSTFRVEIEATVRRVTTKHVFTVNEYGIMNQLPENAGDGVLETRPKVNLE